MSLIYASLIFIIRFLAIVGGGSHRIYDGYPADIVHNKHQASIRLRSLDSFYFGLGHLCGGSLISSSVVLTAAHCLRSAGDRPLNESILIVVLGTLWRNISDSNTLTYNVKQYVTHRSYNKTNISYDIAYVILDGEVPNGHPTVAPIHLAHYKAAEDSICYVSGWGYTEEKVPSDVLLTVDVRIIDMNTCNQGYDGELYEIGQICAGYLEGGKDACSGDSGGPLVCDGLLSGIVSFGDDCGKPNTPGIYTDVAFFEDWIERLNFERKFDVMTTKCNGSKLKILPLLIGFSSTTILGL